MSLQKDIQELVQSNVIDQETGDRIQAHYDAKQKDSGSRLIIAFSALGAILVGLGIILIIAHNWEDFPKSVKTFFAFLPLVIGQLVCLYSLIKKDKSIAWREGSAVFLFFAVATSISVVAQVYNIPGGTGTFLFTWMLLTFPIAYLLRSSMVSLLYIVGITAFGVNVGYESRAEDYRYFMLLALAIPYYSQLIKKGSGNFLLFHHLGIALSLIIMLGSFANESEEIITLAYMALLGLYLQFGKLSLFNPDKKWFNPYQLLGFCGTLFLMYLLTFDWFWNSIDSNYQLVSIESAVSLVLFTATGWLILKRKAEWPFDLIELVFIAVVLLFFFSPNEGTAMIVMNLLTLLVGVQTAWKGTKMNHLGVVNLGLIIIAILITCRFFDQDLSFVTRGILFVMVGLGFFAANYWMIKKRRANDS